MIRLEVSVTIAPLVESCTSSSPSPAAHISKSNACSSRWSASSSQGGGGYNGQGSLVPYRILSLAYEPLVECYCKMKALVGGSHGVTSSQAVGTTGARSLG